MLRRTLMTAGLVAAILLATAHAPLWAHHSNANFDMQKVVTLKGTVAQYDWENPHVLLWWDVKDDSTGKVVRWEGFLASVESENADGLNKNTLKPGDAVIVKGHPARNGSPHCTIGELAKGDGTIICGPCLANKAGDTRLPNGIQRN